MNGGKETIYLGRNSAPAKADESVLNTTLTIKEPRVFQAPVEESTVVTPTSAKQLKLNRHEELKRIGLEKRRLLAAVSGAVVPEVVPRDTEKEARRKDVKRKFQEAANDRSIIKTSILPSTPLANTKHTEHKRQKMRERERQKRAKSIEKKVEKRMDSTEKRIANKPLFGEVMERPSDTIRDLGSKLAQKLLKGKTTFTEAYDKIKKPAYQE